MNNPFLTDDEAKALAKRQIAWLDGALEAAAAMLEALKTQALTQMKEDPGYWINGKREQAYGCVARAMRLAIVLQTRVASGDLWRASTAALAQAIAEPRAALSAPEADHEDTEGPERESLTDRPDRERGEDYGRPIGEMVAQICQDLGIEPDWTLQAGYEPSPSSEPAPTPAPSGASPFVDAWIRQNLPQKYWPADLKPNGHAKPNGHDPP